MSYSLDLRPRDGVQDDGFASRLASADEMRTMLELAAALLAAHPAFVLFRPNAESQAKSFGVDLDTARQRCTHFELTDRASSIQLSIHPQAAGVSLSRSAAPGRTMQLAWKCLRIVEARAGYAAYDPQLGGAAVDLDHDFGRVARAYAGSAAAALGPPESATEPSREWPSGARVMHARFGLGAVVSVEGAGPDAKLTILFASGERKRLVATAGLARC